MTRRSTPPIKHRIREAGERPARAKPHVILDTDVLLQWLQMFDERMANLNVRQEALLRDLGAEPVAREPFPESLSGLV